MVGISSSGGGAVLKGLLMVVPLHDVSNTAASVIAMRSWPPLPATLAARSVCAALPENPRPKLPSNSLSTAHLPVLIAAQWRQTQGVCNNLETRLFARNKAISRGNL